MYLFFISGMTCAFVGILIQYYPYIENEFENNALRRKSLMITEENSAGRNNSMIENCFDTKKKDALSVTQNSSNQNCGDTTQERHLLIDWEELHKVNPEIIGWIYLPEIKLSYPILQNKSNNNYYLNHSFSNSENELGSIYIFKESNQEFKDLHTIIFGHNMRSGQMFGNLSELLKENVFLTTQEIWIYLPKELLKYRIFSVYECSVYDDIYQIGAELTQSDTDELFRHAMNLAVRKRDTGYVSGTRILTLSTCSDSGNSKRRLVVNAVEQWRTGFNEKMRGMNRCIRNVP